MSICERIFAFLRLLYVKSRKSCDAVRNGPEEFNVFELIPFFHKIRICAGFYNDHTFCWIYIDPLAIYADCHKLVFISRRNPPLIPISNRIVGVVVCAWFGILRAGIHAIAHPVFLENLFPIPVSPIQVQPCKPGIVPEGYAQPAHRKLGAIA